MKTLKVIAAFVFIGCALPMQAQEAFTSYYTDNDFLLAPPGALRFGLNGYDNPALLSSLREPDLLVGWSTAYRVRHDWVEFRDHFLPSDYRPDNLPWVPGGRGDFMHWGVFAGVPHAGFGLVRESDGAYAVTDYRFSLGFGNRSFSMGAGYGWSSGDVEQLRRTDLVYAGVVVRPNEYLSIGAIGKASTSTDLREGAIDAAVRPFGNQRLALFGDISGWNNRPSKTGHWSAGAVLEPMDGLRVTGRYFDTKAFTLGVEISFGRLGFSVHPHYGENGHYVYNSFMVRVGAYDRNVFDRAKPKEYVEVNLLGPIGYQRFEFFDNTKTLASILAGIEAAKNDSKVAGIAVNTSGMAADREMLWEIREKLKEFRSAGKKVVVFIDRAGIDVYHFASVADRIAMDPQGMLTLEGYVMGRTFLKGTLEKVGVGFDEWRFFKYKSAVENLSRDRMSDADREQRQALLNEWYRVAKSDISEGRRLSPEVFDSFVNDSAIFLPQDALVKGLVDTLARWDAIGKVIACVEGRERSMTSPGALAAFLRPYDDRWGEPARIAVIYALGECAMDAGINARSLVKVVESVTKDSRVKAVVFRIDSPGGDGMASDIIAEAMKKCSEKKPVIVSQGSVAGSGGYWLSMYADTIVAAPGTITGSIGVIGGWVYDKGLKEKLGMTTDFVKVGEHADLPFGFTLPFIPIGLPDRDLTPIERGKMERSIKTMYGEFVQKVAAGRKLSPERVDSIGQGRIWSGTEGVKVGLVDLLGGLDDAVKIAKKRAGLRQDEEVEIIELPKKGLFNPAVFLPKLFGVPYRQPNEILDHLKFRFEHNGEPMPVMPLDWIETTRH